jgi:nucleoid DNA-binding protein
MTTDYTPPIPASALVREISVLMERPAKEIKPILEALEVVIASHLRDGSNVRLPRLGTLTVKVSPARTGQSFGKETTFPARKRVGFRASKQLREAIETAD